MIIGNPQDVTWTIAETTTVEIIETKVEEKTVEIIEKTIEIIEKTAEIIKMTAEIIKMTATEIIVTIIKNHLSMVENLRVIMVLLLLIAKLNELLKNTYLLRTKQKCMQYHTMRPLTSCMEVARKNQGKRIFQSLGIQTTKCRKLYLTPLLRDRHQRLNLNPPRMLLGKSLLHLRFKFKLIALSVALYYIFISIVT